LGKRSDLPFIIGLAFLIYGPFSLLVQLFPNERNDLLATGLRLMFNPLVLIQGSMDHATLLLWPILILTFGTALSLASRKH
jgi:hypothetical protein